MHFFVENFKISNFLSFFREYDINLKPFTGIMCNYYEGKDDFLRALEFVFGAKLEDLRVENPLDLVHKVFREEFLINHQIESYVEVTINKVQENKKITFRKSIKSGSNFARIEYKVSNSVTSKIFYEEKLNSLNLNIRQKNLIFYESYFTNSIWDCSENLDQIINNCLREKDVYEEWSKAQKKVKYLSKLKVRASEINYRAMKKSHTVISNYANKLERISKNRETLRNKILKNLENSLEESSDSETSSVIDEETFQKELESKMDQIDELENNYDVLVETLNNLKLKEAGLIGQLYHDDLKYAAKSGNNSMLQNLIQEVKAKVQEKETRLSEIESKTQQLNLELENLSQNISNIFLSLYDKEVLYYFQNRWTSYGRFVDYIYPSHQLELLKKIIGTDYFYAHLCDTIDEAVSCMNLMKILKYPQRENFFIFENYSHKLKDVITASGEKGVQINTLEELLIFLCKLKHYGLIDEVPGIIQKEFDYDDTTELPNDYTIYLKNELYLTEDGLISYKPNNGMFIMNNEEELKKTLTKLKIEEEIKYQEYNDLVFSKWEIFNELNSLENDIEYLKRNWKKSPQHHKVFTTYSLDPEIYEEFSDIFTSWEEECQKYESEFHESSPPVYTDENQETSLFSGESMSPDNEDLKEVLLEKNRTKEQLGCLSKKLRSLYTVPLIGFEFQKYFIGFNTLSSENSKFFFDKEFRTLKKLMAEDDLEEFLGIEEWRKNLIMWLNKDFNATISKLKKATENLNNIASERKKKLYPFLEHCRHHLSSTFKHLLSNSLPSIDLNWGSGEEKLHLTSFLGEDCVYVADMKHFNTFVKFTSILTVFLELARFDKIPLMILDEIDEYFPKHNDNLEAVLDSNALEKILPHDENPRFQLLMRIGQFLALYIRKNTPGNQVRSLENDKVQISGPMQIIYFSKEDFMVAADHHIWIHHQILPEEFITEEYDSYSVIHEIKFNETND